MTTITKYVAEDGSEFPTPEGCEAYERDVFLDKKTESFHKELTDKYIDSEHRYKDTETTLKHIIKEIYKDPDSFITILKSNLEDINYSLKFDNSQDIKK